MSAAPKARGPMSTDERDRMKALATSVKHDPAALASGDTAACPALSAQMGGVSAEWNPSNGGAVPWSLFFTVALDMTAVGLVIPMLSVCAPRPAPAVTMFLGATR